MYTTSSSPVRHQITTSSKLVQQRDWLFQVSTWWPVVLWLGVIALESTSIFGSVNTSGPLRRIYTLIFGHVSNNHWEVIHHLIRKAGHFLGYGMIGVSWLRAWRRSKPQMRTFQGFLLALFCTALIAGGDELHQSFLPNRTGLFDDVLLDCSGAISLQVLVILCNCIFAVKRVRLEA